MNNASELILELINAYEAKLIDLEKREIARLKDNFQLYHAVYRAIYELFIQKGIIKPDPYKNDRRLSDIYIPEALPMNENEIDEQLPIKLSEFDNLLDFMTNYTQFKASVLSLKKIKILSGILRYIDWGKLTVTNNHPITHGVANLADKIKQGADQIAASSIQSNHNKIEQVMKVLMKDLKSLADFKREEYKLFIRQRIVQQNPAFQTNQTRESFIKLVKANFAKNMEGEAFFPELVGELHDELFAEDGNAMTQIILSRFHVEEQKKKTDNQNKFNLRDIMLEGLRSLGAASRHLDESLIKLKENAEVLHNRPKSFMERFKEWIISLSQGKKSKEEIFEVEIIDINTTMKKVEKIEFNAFSANVTKKSRYLTTLLIRTSANYLRIEAGTDTQLYELLEKNLLDLKQIHERLDALDTYFKSEAPSLERGKMKGIKVELGNLKNCIALVNQKIHEFVARKEEVEQLKKLGISVDE